MRRKSSASFTKLETTVAKLESSASHQLERVATIGLEIPIEMKLAADICELLKLGGLGHIYCLHSWPMLYW